MTSPHLISQNAVAKAAGVSASTVSRALSNHPSLLPETKRRIQKIAEEMGYKRSAMVSMLTAQLRLGRSLGSKATLAYITSLSHSSLGKANPAYYDFYLGTKSRAEELGYGLDVLWTREKGMTSARMNAILHARGIRGLILAPRARAMSHISLDWEKYAVAAIGHGLPAPRVNFSGAWHYALIHTALRRLKKYGYRRIGFYVSPDSDDYARQAFSARYSLYQQSISTGERVPFLQNPFLKTPAGRKKFDQWFTRHRPEVIVCLGPQVRNWLEGAGYSVPRDVALVDLCLEDDSGSIAGMFEMPRVIAATAVDLVIEQLHHNNPGIPDVPKSVLFEGKWVDGKTLPKITPGFQRGRE